MRNTARKITPVSFGLTSAAPEKDALFLAFEERQAYAKYSKALNASFGKHASGAMTRAAKDARIRGMNRACAEALVNRAISGRTKDTGLVALARVQTDFEDQVTELHDTYIRISGGA